MRQITLQGEIFGLLKTRGWEPKTTAALYRACNKNWDSPHVLAVALQLSDGCAPPPVAKAVGMARKGSPQDSYIQQAAKFIQDTECLLASINSSNKSLDTTSV